MEQHVQLVVDVSNRWNWLRRGAWSCTGHVVLLPGWPTKRLLAYCCCFSTSVRPSVCMSLCLWVYSALCLFVTDSADHISSIGIFSLHVVSSLASQLCTFLLLWYLFFSFVQNNDDDDDDDDDLSGYRRCSQSSFSVWI